MGKDATVFMRALRPHTYRNRPQDEGDVYLASADEVENIENLKFAKQIPPPPKAENRSPVPPPDAVPPDHAAPGQVKVPVQPLTTASMPTPEQPRRRRRG